LDDEPAPHKFRFPVLPPGTMYDADHQCRLQYGNSNASLCGSEQVYSPGFNTYECYVYIENLPG